MSETASASCAEETRALLAQLQQALDQSACARLCVDFAHHIDARNHEPWLDLFTDDGVLDRMGTVARGRAALARFLEARPATVETRHLCTNIRVQILAADEAAGSCYVQFFQGASSNSPDEPATLSSAPSVVEYHDRYRRTPQGWRIQERRIRMAMKP